MGKQLDYLKAYIRPFTTKIKKNFKLNEDSCKLFPDSIRVSPEYESILSLLQRVAFYSLNASMWIATDFDDNLLPDESYKFTFQIFSHMSYHSDS